MSNSNLKIGVAGLGTVGSGVVKLLNRQASLVSLRSGRDITVTAVSARDRSKQRGVNLDKINWCDNPLELAKDENVDECKSNQSHNPISTTE